jgi:hypothetical protein
MKLRENSSNRGAPHLKVPSDRPVHVEESNTGTENVIPVGLASIEGEVELTGQGESVEVADGNLEDRTTKQPRGQAELIDGGDGLRTTASQPLNKTTNIQEEIVRTASTGEEESDEKQGKDNLLRKEVSIDMYILCFSFLMENILFTKYT